MTTTMKRRVVDDAAAADDDDGATADEATTLDDPAPMRSKCKEPDFCGLPREEERGRWPPIRVDDDVDDDVDGTKRKETNFRGPPDSRGALSSRTELDDDVDDVTWFSSRGRRRRRNETQGNTLSWITAGRRTRFLSSRTELDDDVDDVTWISALDAVEIFAWCLRLVWLTIVRKTSETA